MLTMNGMCNLIYLLTCIKVVRNRAATSLLHLAVTRGSMEELTSVLYVLFTDGNATTQKQSQMEQMDLENAAEGNSKAETKEQKILQESISIDMFSVLKAWPRAFPSVCQLGSVGTYLLVLSVFLNQITNDCHKREVGIGRCKNCA